MAQINNTISLAPGAARKLTNVQQVNASGQSLRFTVPARPGGGEFSLLLQVVGSFTGMTSALQISLDGGTTFVSYIGTGPSAAGVFVVPAASTTNPPIAGALYALNVTALSTGSFDVWATIN